MVGPYQSRWKGAVNMKELCIEKHLYERRYQTAAGEWSRAYYVRLKDWKGVRRVWPAGNNLKTARAKRAEYGHRNALKEDFDKDRVQAMTLARWGDLYVSLYAREKKSLADDKRHIQHLCRTLGGNLILSQITLDHVERFKQVRKTEQHRGKAISETTIDRSLEVLRHMLRIVEEKGVIEKVPRVRLYKPENSRERIINEEEYQRLLAGSPLHLKRIILCAYETGMRAGEIQHLTWDKVDLKTGFIRLASEDAKTKRKRAVPLSVILRSALEDIRKEQREGKVAPIDGRVFTWKGKPMTEGWKTAFKTACRKAGLEGLHFHDLRHTFVTRKVREGWDYKRIMAITGHKTFAVFQRYNNPSEDDIKAVVLADPPKRW